VAPFQGVNATGVLVCLAGHVRWDRWGEKTSLRCEVESLARLSNGPEQFVMCAKRKIASYKQTSRYLSHVPIWIYFPLAENLSATLVNISQKLVAGELPVRRPAARMKRLFWGVVAPPVWHKDSFFD
jgi:hypothetical protein